MFRDLLMFCAWAIGGFICVALIALLGFVLFNPGDESELGAIVILSLIGGFCSWILHNMTKLPMLLWRHRQYHRFRIVEHPSYSRSAIQLKMYGIWFYVSIENAQYPTLAFTADDDLRFATFWKRSAYVTQSTIDEIVKSITPAYTKERDVAPILYKNYKKEKIE